MYAKRHGVETQDLETDSANPFVTGDDGYDVFLQNKKQRVGDFEPVQDSLIVGKCCVISPLMVLAEHLCIFPNFQTWWVRCYCNTKNT